MTESAEIHGYLNHNEARPDVLEDGFGRLAGGRSRTRDVRRARRRAARTRI